MQGLARFAVYYTAPGALGDFGAAWLGWDVAAGRAVPQPRIDGLDMAALTDTPRRYGFHATMKAPFRLAGERAALEAAFANFCATEAAFGLAGGLRLARLGGGFLALIPTARSAALAGLEARLVAALDRFRAPLTPAEIARRNPDRLSPRQRDHLQRWGYPHVMEDFQFHMTLTGNLDADTAARASAALEPRLAPLLADPQPIEALSLMGEDAEGRFHLIRRLPLSA
ncbi:DUF1045 domain-containing protein [Paracoccus suum]|uniref:DUF1045 domain-containing protein n=1 Tax=Paracoccus suum TaxID=2259340 RepID=A0A344PH29_9RHOB|nr:DUF1045 domain-containing protein [Paracoccus suum]AXC48684.1 DUF1045 domain-containing protein [Paracoccus suum]